MVRSRCMLAGATVALGYRVRAGKVVPAGADVVIHGTVSSREDVVPLALFNKYQAENTQRVDR